MAMVKATAKEKLLEAAHVLMLARGYNATTVDEICETAGVSKGSFYHFFDTKEDLGLATLKRFHQNSEESFADGEYNQLENPEDKLRGFLDFVDQKSLQFWSEGCLLGKFTIELAETNPRMQQEVSSQFRDLSQDFAVIFEPFSDRLKKAGAPPPLEMGEALLSTIEGYIVLAKAHNDIKKIRQGIRAFRAYVESILAFA